MAYILEYDVDFPLVKSPQTHSCWLIKVHSALSMCGLTAVLSTKLAAEGISCNIVAGTLIKSQLISEWLFDVLKFSKKQSKRRIGKTINGNIWKIVKYMINTENGVEVW